VERQIYALKTLSFREKIAKICPVDPEVICLQEIIKEKVEKKKDITEVKIYSLVGNLAERAKNDESLRISHQLVDAERNNCEGE